MAVDVVKTSAVCLLLAAAMALGQPDRPGVSADAAPKSFASPEAAAQGLVDALKANDRDAALTILGASAREWLSSGDQVADRASIARFVHAYEEKHTLTAAGDARVILVVGNDDFPFPFPLVKADGAWRFDPEQGREEILNRRIGGNELFTIQTLLAIVDAQRDYASVDRNGNGLLEYAQKFMSTPGKKDGLYWKTKEGEAPSPLGDLFAKAVKAGYTPGKGAGPQPYWGYYYKILKAQGKDAPGGAYDYVIKGKMIGGFALVAYPAEYGASGIMTFIVNYGGVVYQKDLGKETGKIAGALTKYDPDKTWTNVEEQEK